MGHHVNVKSTLITNEDHFLRQLIEFVKKQYHGNIEIRVNTVPFNGVTVSVIKHATSLLFNLCFELFMSNTIK